jgi:CRP-like cAMP-binding protein
LRQRRSAARSADPAAELHDFLCEFARRLGQTDPAPAGGTQRLRLPMSRLEIGQYLGYAEETVCRSFHKLQQRGIVTVSGRSVTLHATNAESE